MLLGCKTMMDPFQGTWGEVDTRYILPDSLLNLHWCFSDMISSTKFLFRFSYIAICCLSILKRLDKINVDKAVNYIVSCKNLDGGFGCTPGGESHAGQSMLCIYHCIIVQILYLNCSSRVWILYLPTVPFDILYRIEFHNIDVLILTMMICWISLNYFKFVYSLPPTYVWS